MASYSGTHLLAAIPFLALEVEGNYLPGLLGESTRK